LQIEGDHLFKPLRLDWKFSVGNSGRNEPDVRLFENNFQIRAIVDSVSGDTLGYDTVSYKLKNPGNYYYPTHYYREIDENSREFQLDLTYAFMERFGKDAKLKMGSSIQKKERENMEQRFEVNYSTSGGGLFNGDPADVDSRLGVNWSDTSTIVRPITEEIVFSHEEWVIFGNDTIDCTPHETPETKDPCIVIDSVVTDTIRWDTSYNIPFDFWLVQEDERRGDNTYRGEKNVNAVYGMLEFPLTSWLLLVGGARYEMTEMVIFNSDGTRLDGGIDEDDILPSLSFTAALTDNMNLRLAYGRTLARPTFKEKSPSATYEFTLGEILNGNPELKQTKIDNYDFRWEYFNGPGEIMAMSVFYKKFKDPIEKSLIGNNNDVKYLNVGSATVYGIEFEMRQSLDKLWSRLRNFQFEGNLTLAKSEVDIDPEEMASRQSFKIATTRPLQGQSPYILNLGLTYENYRSRTVATVLFNIFGERLSNVSRGNVPDVFEQPRPMLDFTFSQGFWKHLKAKLTVKNILNEINKETIEYEGVEFIYRQYSTGRSISVGLSYSL
jgi:TonB-dependent receptor